jgi:hypothetical protein
MELTQADFLAFVPFSKNISADTLDVFAKDALKMDVAPLLDTLKPESKDSVTAGTLVLSDSFGDDLLKGFWVCSAFDKMIQVHGFNITQAGFTKTKGDSYEQGSDTERGRVQAFLRSKIAYYRAKLSLALAEHQQEPDSCSTKSGRSSIGLYVGKRK